MAQFLLVVLVVALACGIAFAIVVLVTGEDPGLTPVGNDGIPLDLPGDRPLSEADVLATRFDTGLRGYRTTQVDEAVSRLAYDVGFKDELIKVLAGEVSALRAGRTEEADSLREVRRKALGELGDDTAAMDPDAQRKRDDDES
ncbi:MAG TPA: DivIVA domain-containing protein [Candidatus Stackebrandtia excrementipullorum]|nr:DivIVA domain-containing protein [Candidatus Stackebrandtia excrementipullorum]